MDIYFWYLPDSQSHLNLNLLVLKMITSPKCGINSISEREREIYPKESGSQPPYSYIAKGDGIFILVKYGHMQLTSQISF